MTPCTPALCIHNPHAGSGSSAANRRWLSANLAEHFGAVQWASTTDLTEVGPILKRALPRGLKTVLALGGDGTTHHIVNALMKLKQEMFPQEMPAFGVLPFGTGCDWSRGVNQPLGMKPALIWLTQAELRKVDIGEVKTDQSRSFFLNIASCGFSGEVAKKIQQLPQKQPWSYFKITMQSAFGHSPAQLRIDVDGHLWYEGKAAMVACCNGSHFGRGMRIAPNARCDDGWLEVILVPRLDLLNLVRLLPSAYFGSSFGRGALHQTQGKQIRITSDSPLHYETDGEASSCHFMEISLHPRSLRTFLPPD